MKKGVIIMEKDLKTIQLFDEDGNEINFNVIAFFDMVNPETDEGGGCPPPQITCWLLMPQILIRIIRLPIRDCPRHIVLPHHDLVPIWYHCSCTTNRSS